MIAADLTIAAMTEETVRAADIRVREAREHRAMPREDIRRRDPVTVRAQDAAAISGDIS